MVLASSKQRLEKWVHGGAMDLFCVPFGIRWLRLAEEEGGAGRNPGLLVIFLCG